METRAAVLFDSPGKWETITVDLEGPHDDEVLVEMVASGLCHSDDHYTAGDIVPVLPLCGGHEGSGVVRELGSGVRGLEVGDHVVTSFIAACGRCRWCAEGKQQLCNAGGRIGNGTMADGTTRMRHNGSPVFTAAALGTFTEWQVYDEASLVKVPKELPLDVLCLLACGIPTGWGSATTAVDITVGDVVIVMGCGGVGMNAVQGAAHKGATHVIAVDPAPFKREMALRLGATVAFDDIAPAADFARSVTEGQGADAAIVTVGRTAGEHVGQAVRAIRKGGTVVITGIGRIAGTIPVDLVEISMFQKRLQGCLYGNEAPRAQIPRLLRLYESGSLKIDELVTERYSISEVNQGYADMNAGKNIRGIIDFRLGA